ncbi:MAG: adenylate/guanylate cyclase domain-containing protein, partial [Actinomycetota bacterium]
GRAADRPHVTVPGWSRKNLDDPDELIEFPHLNAEVVEIGGLTVARLVHEPGWRWSTDVRPQVGGEWCQARHIGTLLTGRMGVTLEDGSQFELEPGDVFEIPPGHDGYVIGNETAVLLEWAGFRTFAGGKGRAVLTTLLFTDLVESTAIAARLGDVAWRELLSGHYAAIRSQLERSGGREVNTTGDGILAIFDGPASALRCAAAIRTASLEQGLHIRAGVHVGEVQMVGDNVQGIAVHEAARVMAAAAADEIMVSETTKVLASGGGLAFEDRGLHELKGIEEPRRLFAYVAE